MTTYNVRRDDGRLIGSYATLAEARAHAGIGATIVIVQRQRGSTARCYAVK